MYVICTSGSTGKPKGVLLTHANVRRMFSAVRAEMGFTSGDLLAGEVLAEPRGDGYTLSGEKRLINNATRGDLLCVLARTAPEGSARLQRAAGRQAQARPGAVPHAPGGPAARDPRR
ncbi:alkylation response protein AidB-like acyl-CoA dehydrogenase [Kitasatospora sp. MAA19]|nr:alkylation response protein AidB-like acyl-CoA dehydrogenase [Kitasatospora sp. MAA19]